MSWGEGLWNEYGWGADVPILVEVEFVVPAHTFEFQSLTESTSSVEFVVPCHTFLFEANIDKGMTMEFVVPAHTFVLEAGTDKNMTMDFVVPCHQFGIASDSGFAMTMEFIVPAHTFETEATIDRFASMAFVVPAHVFTLYAEIVTGTPVYGCVVVNSVNGAHTEYTGYEFDSMAFINGKVYMAGDGGLFYESDAQDEVVPWSIKTGEIDSHRGNEAIPSTVKREIEVYHDFVTDNGMELLVTGDRDGEFQYKAHSAEYDDRVPVGKGFDSRWYSFEMKNDDSLTLNGSNIRILSNPTKRTR